MIYQIIEQFRAAYSQPSSSDSDRGASSVDELVAHFHEVFDEAEIVRHKLEEVFERLVKEGYVPPTDQESDQNPDPRSWQPNKPR